VTAKASQYGSRDSNQRYAWVGIVSFGVGCAEVKIVHKLLSCTEKKYPKLWKSQIPYLRILCSRGKIFAARGKTQIPP
jgi:hypothetical protein